MRQSKNPSVIVGLVEVENAKVADDLALLYNKIAFELLTVKIYPFFLKDDEGERDYTRGVFKSYWKFTWRVTKYFSKSLGF